MHKLWHSLRAWWARGNSQYHKWSQVNWFDGDHRTSTFKTPNTVATVKSAYSESYPRPWVSCTVWFSSHLFSDQIPGSQKFDSLDRAYTYVEDIVYSLEPRPWWHGK